MRRHGRMAILRANCSIKYRAPHPQMWSQIERNGTRWLPLPKQYAHDVTPNEKSFSFYGAFMMWKRYQNITLQMIMERFHYTSIWHLHMCRRLCSILICSPRRIDWLKETFRSAFDRMKNVIIFVIVVVWMILAAMFAYSLHFSLNGWDINVVIKYTWSAQYLSLMAIIIFALFRCAGCQNVAINRTMCTQYSLSNSPTYLSYFIQSTRKKAPSTRERGKKAIFSPP